MDKLPKLTAEELDMCQQTFRSFDKDGAGWCLSGSMRIISQHVYFWGPAVLINHEFSSGLARSNQHLTHCNSSEHRLRAQ